MGPIHSLAAGRHPANTRKARVVDGGMIRSGPRDVKRQRRLCCVLGNKGFRASPGPWGR
jgi:hypothetical protein